MLNALVLRSASPLINPEARLPPSGASLLVVRGDESVSYFFKSYLFRAVYMQL